MDKIEPVVPPHFNFIAVEGVIGAGKSSLCEMLAEMWGARLVFEDVDGNPFLPKFYEERKNHAFQTQLWFLLSRYRQFSEAGVQQDLFHRITLSDYLFAKDRIFANINLDDDELRLYNLVAGALEAQTPVPDLVVYLQASSETLLRRIARRGRPFEYNMDPGYIGLLNEAYNHFFFHYDRTPLLVINTDEVDFENDRSDLDEIAKQIAQAPPGVTYYRPLRSSDKAELKDRRTAVKKPGEDPRT
ncbi:MAG: deoxynucleoside kinase [Chitinispirillaceae bacterium]|nr:deoxynucleoside kinase [Chitinispirillaceae bacterium]